MGIRTVCLVLAVVASGWLQWAFLAGAIVLPYVAVVMANAGRERAAEPEVPGLPALTSGPADGAGPVYGGAGPSGARGSDGADRPDGADDVSSSDDARSSDAAHPHATGAGRPREARDG